MRRLVSMRRLAPADACYGLALLSLPLVGVDLIRIVSGRDLGAGLQPAYLLLAAAWALRLGVFLLRLEAHRPDAPDGNQLDRAFIVWPLLAGGALLLSGLGLQLAPAPLLAHEAWPRFAKQVVQVVIMVAFLVYPALWTRGPRRWRWSLQLLAWAECEEASEAKLTLAGQDGFGRVLVTEDGPGETIEIRSGGSWRDPPRYTEHTFRSVSAILKPRTKGYVHLFGYEPVPMQYVQLGMYGPSEHVPGFRRYKVPQCHCGYVDALVQMRVLPLEFDSDVLVIQNLPALKKMLQAITIEDAGDMAIAREHEARAIKMIEDDQLWIDDVVPEIQNDLHRYRALPDDVM